MEKLTAWAGKDGQFRRQVSSFRNFISENGPFPPEAGRYHLYVSLACPWAHRTLIARKLKGLEEVISISTVHWHLQAPSWRFLAKDETCNGATVDHLYGFENLKQLYLKANPDYDARFTVPVLWDKKLETIVNNESSEILRMLNSGFNSVIQEPGKRELDLYLQHLQKEIDLLNDWVYNEINNGVYKSGFATTQEAYEENVAVLFRALNRVEELLSRKTRGSFLVGEQLTEADIRLFVTIIRFDCCYVQHFKCDMGSIRHDYPHINRWMKR